MSAIMPVDRSGFMVQLISFIILAMVASGAMAADSHRPSVSVSNSEEVRFSLSLPAMEWVPQHESLRNDGAWEGKLPGFVSMASPGHYRTPRQGGWLVVPPGTTPRLSVIKENWVPLDGRQLGREHLPRLQMDPEFNAPIERPLTIRPGQRLEDLDLTDVPEWAVSEMRSADPALTSGPAVVLGEVVYWRGRRIVPYSIQPLRAEGDGQARRALKDGEWRIQFVANPTAGKDAPEAAVKRLGDGGDEHFAGFFLNGKEMKGLPTEATHKGYRPEAKSRVARKANPLAPEVRIPVQQTQLYRVRASELVDAGLLPSTGVNESQIRLYQRRYVEELDDPSSPQSLPYVEVEVPIRMVGEGNEFAGDDLFIFWGLRLRDDDALQYDVGEETFDLDSAGDDTELYNDANMYWLMVADPIAEPWARMEEQSLPGSGGSPLTQYRRYDYWNEAYKYRENGRYWSMDRYYYNDLLEKEALASLSLWSPVLDQTGATLQAGVHGFSNSTSRQLFPTFLDGEVVVESLPPFWVTSWTENIYSTVLPTSVLTATSPLLKMTRENPSASMYAFLDWVSLEYDALYEAPYGRLLFNAGPTLDVNDIEIPGFGSNDVGLIEVTDKRNPEFVTLAPANLIADGEGYKLSLRVDQSAGQRLFYVARSMTSNGVPDIRYNDAVLVDNPVVPTILQEASADVLVITHSEFDENVEAWIEYRRGRLAGEDLTFQVLHPEDVFDWYSGGIKNPWAIKRLVNHALDNANWGTFTLLLVGDANENPRELGVMSSGRQWSKDWVPTHFHIQYLGGAYIPEVMGSDEWYANPVADDDNFPDGSEITGPPSLYVGRIPCNSTSEFDRLFTKIKQIEMVGQDTAWRKRGLFIADDAWTQVDDVNLGYSPSEEAFRESEERMADMWVDNPAGVSLESDMILLTPLMMPFHPELDDTVRGWQARDYCEESGGVDVLIAGLSRGGLIAHYQGHANPWVLCHEYWFQHAEGGLVRQDVSRLTNTGRPWWFCGMGCHIGDFIQNVGKPTYNVPPGLGEKFLFWTDAGGAATYASCGFEYLTLNMVLSEWTMDNLTTNPPTQDVHGNAITSRWMLGEVTWSAEADLLATVSSGNRKAMAYQYAVLGDPLMMLDCGTPEVESVLVGEGGGAISGEVDLLAIDDSGQRQVVMQARDEAGIDRLVVRDTNGEDLTSSVVTETVASTNGSRQVIDYELDLPVRAFNHDILVHVYDSAASGESDDYQVLTFHIAQETATVTAADGEPHDAENYVFTEGEAVDFEVTVTSAAWFSEATVVDVQGQSLEITSPLHTVADAHTMRVTFTATATGGKAERGVDLVIDGSTTYIPLEASASGPPTAGISDLVNYPNPMRDETRFIFRSTLHSGQGSLRVWTVSGRQVVSMPFTLAGDGEEIVSWDGRDREGDKLANGTYLYRVEVESSAGQVKSEMQRLVIMR